MVRFAPSYLATHAPLAAPFLLVREQFSLADDYGPRLLDPDLDSLPVPPPPRPPAGSRLAAGRAPAPDPGSEGSASADAAVANTASEALLPDSGTAGSGTAGFGTAGFGTAASGTAASVAGEAPEAPEAPVPDPFDDAEALEELEEQITTLAAHIHAATHRLLTLIADFDRRHGWELGGHRTCAHWLSFRTGIDLGAAREKVRTARALVGLPETSASMGRGELSFSKVRALTRVATETNEEELLDFARGSTTAQLERMVRGVRRGSRRDEAALERERYESRTFSVVPDDEGMYVVRGRLPAELGALLMRAVEAASDALYREARWPRPGQVEGQGAKAETGAQTGPETGVGVSAETSERAAAQRRADALGLLAERALAVGFGGRGDEDPVPISGSRAERYQVMLHVEVETLKADGEGGRSELEDGTGVSAETSQRLCCDAGVVKVGHAPDGRILDVGRRTRTIPPSLRRALEVRDQGCRFPGCGLRFTEGHHIRHWAEGGETSLANCVLLCRYHHRLMHEGGWKMDWWGEGRPVFFDPRGGTHFDGRWEDPRRKKHPQEQEQELPEPQPVESLHMPESLPPEQPPQPRPQEPPDPVTALLDENQRRGVRPDGWTASARWKREADIPDPVYFRALEALE